MSTGLLPSKGARSAPRWRGAWRGCAGALALLAALSAVMFAFRSHLSIATVGLVLVVPVVVGVIGGGAIGGTVALATGAVVYDVVFVPPYGSLTVGEPQDWVVLVVYVVVMALVTKVANDLARAETVARARTEEAERLFVVSELLVGERPLAELLELIVSAVHEAFAAESVVLLLPQEGELRPAASRGEPLSEDDVARLTPSAGVLSSLAGWRRLRGGAGWGRTLVLSAAGRPVGLLALTGLRPPLPSRELLTIFANHVALAVERAQLRQQAVRMGVLEEVDRLRRALVGAVSHDLRTPLATIKASSSAMLDDSLPLDKAQTRELLELIEAQTDRLTRLVSNLLDMSRIQSGALVPDALPVDLRDLVVEAVQTLSPPAAGRIEVAIADDVSQVEVDHVFITEALVNLLDNALRHAPDGTPVVVDAIGEGGRIRVRVSDRGPGIPAADRDAVVEQAARRAGDGDERPRGGTGVGLTIVKAFVEAHGGHLDVEEAEGGGARFCFDVPAAPPSELSA